MASHRRQILRSGALHSSLPTPGRDSREATSHQEEIERRVREFLLALMPPLPGDYYVSPAETARAILRLPKRKARGPMGFSL
ncbi:hypothetical protein EVAR_27358_1 [Eumeta japonica]|uniref:Uncharacterized protein n=1 Tax=Eumeta variegata TaxID=151549 RepID=A0A4C1UCB6_EUMVA|nr:hypothetical protein EVAR_27358_1 [Eumeta japonica]